MQHAHVRYYLICKPMLAQLKAHWSIPATDIADVDVLIGDGYERSRGRNIVRNILHMTISDGFVSFCVQFPQVVIGLRTVNVLLSSFHRDY